MKSRNIHLLMCIAFLAKGTACAQSAQTPAPPQRATIVPPTTASPNPVAVIPSRTPWITTTVRPPTIPIPRTSTPVPIRVYPPSTRTGIREVDDVIAAALAGDIAAKHQLIRYTITGCTKAVGMGGPPKCEYGEMEGTRVEVFPILGPEGGFVRRPSIDSVLQFKVKGLYGVYRVPANAYKEDYWPAGNYGIVLIRDDGPALTLLVEDGGIVRIVYHMLPLEMALKQDVGEWLLPPPTASPMSNVLLTPIPASSLQVIRPDNATRIARVAQLGKGAITSYRDIRNPRSTSPSRQMVGSWPLVTEMARCFSPEPCERRLGAASCFSCRTISLK